MSNSILQSRFSRFDLCLYIEPLTRKSEPSFQFIQRPKKKAFLVCGWVDYGVEHVST